MGIAGLSWADGIQEFTVFAGVAKNLGADGGIAKSIGRLVLSGLPSLELLKLVTNEEAFDKWVPILAESSASC
uniref:Uncharacterized protein n=1 Tax=Vitis vinifera TaxID=29760 RepID=A5AVK9_VITVI|nr:hypothetical protein VITISV_020989 [Vitis vinifera]